MTGLNEFSYRKRRNARILDLLRYKKNERKNILSL